LLAKLLASESKAEKAAARTQLVRLPGATCPGIVAEMKQAPTPCAWR